MHSAPSSPNPAPAQRLDGLDLARYLAFVGMVIVNFKIVMGAENEQGLLASLTAMLEGRAAATFVVLAGIGLGLAARRAASPTIATTLKRALFLLAIGLLNMTVFEADILHYYAFYFVFGAVLLPLSTRWLIGAILGLNALFLAMVVLLNYDAGWEWESYSYSGFWTPAGFVRNLFFNGWHPVVPWLGFLLFGVVLSRLALGEWRVQKALVAGGAATLGGAHALSAYLQGVAPSIDPELAALVTTSPIPPAPLYFLAGIGAACAVTGACLMAQNTARRTGVLRLLAPAGRQTLTLYIAHILIGMGTLEGLGLLGNQTLGTAVAAALVFCAAATVYASLWTKAFGRGPVEALMRKTAG